MDFELTTEQAMLKESLTRLLGDRCDFEARRRLVRTESGFSRELWAGLAELGVLAAPFAEADGGLGGGPVETLVIGEALGAVLSAEPYLATVVMAGTALRLSSNNSLRAALVPAIAAGELVAACALDRPAFAARRTGGGWVVSGCARAVAHAGAADRLVVATDSADGPVVVLIETAAAGVTRRALRTFDGLPAAELTLAEVAVGETAVLAEGAEAEALAARVVEHAIAWLAAEAVGIMQSTLDATLEHLKTRRQFGQALGKFQALQHRAAEMLISLEQARSMALYAAMMTDDPDPLERRKAFAAIKAVTSNAASFVGRNAVQLHGGIGLTEEHRVGWALRRLTMIELQFGDAGASAARLAELGGLVEPA